MIFKTRKAATKRIQIKKFFLKRKKTHKAHLLRKKNSKRLRRLSVSSKVHKSDLKAYSLMISY